jgi:hypothetical protein
MVAIQKKDFTDSAEEILLTQNIGPGLRLLTDQDLIVNHFFAPGLYARSLARRAGSFIIGHRHKTAHLNILLTGRLRVYMDGVVTEISGPSVPFLSRAGVRKATLALEDSVLITFHPTNETDLDKLEEELIEKSPLFQEMEEAGIIAKLRGAPSLS